MDLYAENILDHYRHPRNKNLLPQQREKGRDEGGQRISHEEVNLSCGDALTIHLQIADGQVTAMWWEGSGCAISQAAMSMLTEELSGKSLDDVDALTKENVYELLGVPVGPRRTKCALLGLHTLKNAVRKFRGEEMQGWVSIAA